LIPFTWRETLETRNVAGFVDADRFETAADRKVPDQSADERKARNASGAPIVRICPLFGPPIGFA
jgi:hypothetical protein